MLDTLSMPHEVTAEESYIKTSDSVELRIIDFKPGTDVSEKPVWLAFAAVC